MKLALIVEDVPETRDWLETLVRGAFPECEIVSRGTVRAAVAAGGAGAGWLLDGGEGG